MLVDPGGHRMLACRAIEVAGKTVEDTTGEFEYLVEACDPCEANDCAYSFGCHTQRPRQILPGGYISFIDSQADEVQQIPFLGSEPQLRNLGRASGPSLRGFVDGKTNALVAKDRKPNHKVSEWCKKHRQEIEAGAIRKAKSYELLAKAESASGD